MPLYFAYGANMERSGMAERCPASTPRRLARLMGHRFTLMREGYATVRREGGAVVYGLLWDLALADIKALDRFEEVGKGLYTKVFQPVLTQGGAHQAMVYIGRNADGGLPQPGYMEAVVAAAEALSLPITYLDELRRFLPQDPASAVRPRFKTPFER